MNYSTASAQSKLYNETNDCSVIAMAIAANVSYEIALKALSDAGRKPRTGVTEKMIGDALVSLGKRSVLVTNRSLLKKMAEHDWYVKHVTVRQFTMFPWLVDKGAAYLLFINGHVLAYKDGDVHDYTKNRKNFVRLVVEIV